MLKGADDTLQYNNVTTWALSRVYLFVKDHVLVSEIQYRKSIILVNR